MNIYEPFIIDRFISPIDNRTTWLLIIDRNGDLAWITESQLYDFINEEKAI